MTRPSYLAALIFIGFLLLVFFTHMADFISNQAAPSLFYPLYSVDARASLSSIGSLAEVITSLFGIIITVVAIIVNLSANRYTQKMIDIFINEKINIIILWLFSITSLYGIWIINLIRFTDRPTDYIPKAQLMTYLFLVSLSIILIVPYFYYVFQFLKPASIIAKIEGQAKQLLNEAKKLKNKPAKTKHLNKQSHIKKDVIGNIEQLTEICKSSVNNADQALALSCLTSLRDIMLRYIEIKEEYIKGHPGDMPFNPKWYASVKNYFLGLNEPIIVELQEQGYWVEYKILEEFISIFIYSFEIDTKVTYQTVINITDISKICIKNDDVVLLRDIIRFFNTLLKISIIKQDSQNTIYVFYQYYLTCRELIESFPEWNDTNRKKLVENIAKYFKIYGQLGEQKRIEKVLEYSAYFLRLVNEQVFDEFSDAEDRFIERVLKIFLTVDDVPRQKSHKEALLGVRQHQAILASFYMVEDSDEYQEDHASPESREKSRDLPTMIYNDMKDETAERLCEIANSILDVTQEKPFEIDNLGINPIFIRQPFKEKLKLFFNRFGGIILNGDTFESKGESVSTFVLINLTDNSKGVPLPENKDISIGRDKKNYLQLSNKFGFVSRFHAVIRIKCGKCFYEDLDDNNSNSYITTIENYKNGSDSWEKLVKGEETLISNNTVIRLGRHISNSSIKSDAQVCDIKIAEEKGNNSKKINR